MHRLVVRFDEMLTDSVDILPLNLEEQSGAISTKILALESLSENRIEFLVELVKHGRQMGAR